MAEFDHINLEDFVIDTVEDTDGNIYKEIDGYRLMVGDNFPAEEVNLIHGDVPEYSDEGIEIFKRFCAEKRVSYYSAPKENFFMYKAYDLVAEEGNPYFMVENLS